VVAGAGYGVHIADVAATLLSSIKGSTCYMRRVLSHWLLAAFLLSSSSFMGCAGEEPAPTPQNMEELRQQQKEKSEAFHKGK
jgi:hypothetical protein